MTWTDFFTGEPMHPRAVWVLETATAFMTGLMLARGHIIATLVGLAIMAVTGWLLVTGHQAEAYEQHLHDQEGSA